MCSCGDLKIQISAEDDRACSTGAGNVAEAGGGGAQAPHGEEGMIQEVRRLTPEGESVALLEPELLLESHVEHVAIETAVVQGRTHDARGLRRSQILGIDRAVRLDEVPDVGLKARTRGDEIAG